MPPAVSLRSPRWDVQMHVRISLCLRLRWTCELRLQPAFSDSCFRCRAVVRGLNALIFPPKPKPN